MPAKKSPTPHPDLESVLVTDAQIRRRVKSLGRELKKTYGNEEITVVAIMNGALVFTADLLREVDNTIRLDCIRTTSYGSATESHGTPKLVHGLTLDVTDRHVLVVDDILDTGKTTMVELRRKLPHLSKDDIRTSVERLRRAGKI